MSCRPAVAAAFLALTSAPLAAEVSGAPWRYEHDGMTFEGFVAHDPARPSRGTVLIVHDWDGVNAYEQARARMLAEQGYTAFAIDLYGAEAVLEGSEDYRRLSGALYADRATFRARLAAAIGAAEGIPGATEAMVMIGYCFGGAAVLEAARAGAELAGFVSFHGGLNLPEGQDYSAVTAPVMLFHGSADPVSGMADLAALLDALQAAGVPHGAQVFGGARHSFTVPGSRDFDADADAASWAGLQEFLDRVF